jgi:hypothetical protein
VPLPYEHHLVRELFGVTAKQIRGGVGVSAIVDEKIRDTTFGNHAVDQVWIG